MWCRAGRRASGGGVFHSRPRPPCPKRPPSCRRRSRSAARPAPTKHATGGRRSRIRSSTPWSIRSWLQTSISPKRWPGCSRPAPRPGSPAPGSFPASGASASATDSDSPSNAGFGQQFRELAGGDDSPLPGGFEFPDRLGITTYSPGIDFAYELDFWGRARNDARAAGMDYLASESDYDAARIGVLATTITTYFEIVDLRRRTALASETVDVLLEREELAETRYDRGLVTSFELYQVRQELRNTQAGLPPARERTRQRRGAPRGPARGLPRQAGRDPPGLSGPHDGERPRCRRRARRPAAAEARCPRGVAASGRRPPTPSGPAGPNCSPRCRSPARSASRHPRSTGCSAWTSCSAICWAT